jgi:hypothetical protein
LDNSGQTVFSGVNDDIGAGDAVAQSFETGPNAGGYSINSVSLALENAQGSPNQPITVSIYDSVGDLPGSEIFNGLLSGPASPTTSGLYSYSPSVTLTLDANTTYWITATSTSSPGAYIWSYTSSVSYTAADGWSIPGTADSANTYALSSDNASTWFHSGSGSPSLFSIDATPVAAPEPAILQIMGAGLFCMTAAWRIQRRHNRG